MNFRTHHLAARFHLNKHKIVTLFPKTNQHSLAVSSFNLNPSNGHTVWQLHNETDYARWYIFVLLTHNLSQLLITPDTKPLAKYLCR